MRSECPISYISAGKAREKILTSGGSSPESLSVTFEADDAHFHISFASMLAPTPDWFFGLDNFSLKNSNEWISDTTFDIYPYDSGTKYGDEYSYSFGETSPWMPVYSRKSVLPFSDQPVAKVKFTRTDNLTAKNVSTNVSREHSAQFLGITSRKLNYKISENGLYRFSIYSASGRELFSTTELLQTGSLEVPTEKIGAGVHFAHIETPSGSVTHRFSMK